MFQLSIRRLASQLCGLFVEVEGGQFESRLASTLPVIEQQLEPGKYKQVGLFYCCPCHKCLTFFTTDIGYWLYRSA